MKRMAFLLFTALLLTGCANQQDDPKMIKFEKEINSFCDNIADIDESINEITNISGDEQGLKDAKVKLLQCLDDLEEEFRNFSGIDFPEEFDYLEDMADEAGDYMIEAVNTYHTIYGTADGYKENMEEYANENYARAYKRVRVIVALLRGETPDEEGLTIQ